MQLLEKLEVLFEVMDGVWKIVWLFGDLAFVLSQAFPVDAVFVKHFPVLRHVAPTLQIR